MGSRDRRSRATALIRRVDDRLALLSRVVEKRRAEVRAIRSLGPFERLGMFGVPHPHTLWREIEADRATAEIRSLWSRRDRLRAILVRASVVRLDSRGRPIEEVSP